jgi:hypothetical protein
MERVDSSQYSRFPRALKDSIGADKENIGSRAQQILFRGFQEGRLPAAGEVEDAMLEVVRGLLG